MDKITKHDLKDFRAAKLTLKLLYRLDDELIEQRYVGEVAELIDALDGSRMELDMVPYDDKSSIFLRLRCGEHICSEKLLPGYLSGVIKLAPFMAACVGRDEPEPSKLEALERRVAELEKHVGLDNEF